MREILWPADGKPVTQPEICRQRKICHGILLAEPAGIGKGDRFMSKERKKQDVTKEKKAGREDEKQQYLGGLKRLTEKGVTIYMDGQVSGPTDWEKLFEIREDNLFYMGDYVQADTGGIKEVRFDKVYLSDADIPEEEKRKKNKKKGGD